MSLNKDRKRQEIRQKTAEKTRKRKARQAEKQKKSSYKLSKIELLQKQVDILTAELEHERAKSSRLSNNISHGSFRTAVLNDEAPKAEPIEEGFNKNAWAPPEDQSETTKTDLKEPTKAGFNKTAWAPPNEQDS